MVFTFFGGIDEVGIFTRALSDSEIADVLALGRACAELTVFRRGDTDDNGTVGLTDAVGILNFLFTGGAEPTCLESADADDNGAVQLTDAVRILTFLFAGGAALPPPGPEPCGADPEGAPQLGCESYTNC